MASIDAYVSDEVGLFKAGYRHFHLDDCWAAKERNATGYAYPEKDHFPNGMKPVIDYVHSKGKDGDNLVFGLYTCGGKETCVGGRVGSEDHWEQDAAVYAEWGVDWVKMVRARSCSSGRFLSCRQVGGHHTGRGGKDPVIDLRWPRPSTPFLGFRRRRQHLQMFFDA